MASLRSPISHQLPAASRQLSGYWVLGTRYRLLLQGAAL
jgi:hypothetical protein